MEKENKLSKYYETLKNPPIIEALFEIKWRVSNKIENPLFPSIDIKFKFFPALFYEKIKNRYPEIELLPFTIPDEMDVYLPRFKFRKKPNGYPLIQIGPGVLTVNLDKNFTQELFFSSCKEALSILFSILPDIEIIEILIHYIDGFEFNYEKDNAFEFLEKNLHTHFNFTVDLFKATNINSLPSRFHLEANYHVDNPQGFFMCQLRSGIRKADNQKLILMDTIFRSLNNDIPSKDKLPEWIQKADNLIHKWFFKMIENIRAMFE